MKVLRFMPVSCALLMAYFCLTAACSTEENPEPAWSVCQAGQTGNNGCSQCTCMEGRWSCPVSSCEDLNHKTGFVEIEPVSFTLQDGDGQASYTSSRARIWYAFQPAQEDPADKPLVVFFNGGPGCSTSGLLFAFNTAALSLDPAFNGGLAIGSHPNAWTSFSNLLYIDARGTGFSYMMMSNPQDTALRQAEFSTKNFNSFFDGADFIRVILRILRQHPSIQSNPVLIAGESYGGVRAAVIMHMLLYYSRYQDGASVYSDPALVHEIQGHLEVLHPTHTGQIVPPNLIAQQFSHQILIQAVLAGRHEFDARGELFEQAGSIIYQIAAEEGLSFIPCAAGDTSCRPSSNAFDFITAQAGRDIYTWSKPANWLLDLADQIQNNLTQVNNMSTATGIELTTVSGLLAENRTEAFREGDPAFLETALSASWLAELPAPVQFRLKSRCSKALQAQNPHEADGNFASVFGEIADWDDYYGFCNDYAYYAFYNEDSFSFDIMTSSLRFGRMLLENLIYVKTFVTHANLDLVVYSPGQPLALARYEDLVSACQHDTAPAGTEDRAGRMQVEYLPGAFGTNVGGRTIRFPYYEEAGHSVTVSQPAEFLEDVIAWYNE